MKNFLFTAFVLAHTLDEAQTFATRGSDAFYTAALMWAGQFSTAQAAEFNPAIRRIMERAMLWGVGEKNGENEKNSQATGNFPTLPTSPQ